MATSHIHYIKFSSDAKQWNRLWCESITPDSLGIQITNPQVPTLSIRARELVQSPIPLSIEGLPKSEYAMYVYKVRTPDWFLFEADKKAAEEAAAKAKAEAAEAEAGETA